jgi:hypothetical protein
MIYRVLSHALAMALVVTPMSLDFTRIGRKQVLLLQSAAAQPSGLGSGVPYPEEPASPSSPTEQHGREQEDETSTGLDSAWGNSGPGASCPPGGCGGGFGGGSGSTIAGAAGPGGRGILSKLPQIVTAIGAGVLLNKLMQQNQQQQQPMYAYPYPPPPNNQPPYQPYPPEYQQSNPPGYKPPSLTPRYLRALRRSGYPQLAAANNPNQQAQPANQQNQTNKPTVSIAEVSTVSHSSIDTF